MENLRIYDAVRAVPTSAKKPIQAGRLKGKTDINPLWRIKTLTEQFGPCGEGWIYSITKREFVPGNGGEIAVFVDIDLSYKLPNGDWALPIPGSGGSMYVVSETKGLYTDDEAPKKALTDAISVACKALGIGADVYWEADATKYSARQQDEHARKDVVTPEQLNTLYAIAAECERDEASVAEWVKKKHGCAVNAMTQLQYTTILNGYMKLREAS